MPIVHHLAPDRVLGDALLAEVREAVAAGRRVVCVPTVPVRTSRERLVRLEASLRGAGVPAHALPEVLVETDGREEAGPLHGLAERRLRYGLGEAEGSVQLVAGGVGRAPDGRRVALGTDGGLLTACLVAAALGAEEVHHWTGGTTLRAADPDIVPGAPHVAALHVREAAEMSFYGGPLPSMRAMRPAAAAEIPIVLRPVGEATRIDQALVSTRRPVRAVASVADLALLRLEASGLARSIDMLSRFFASLRDAGAEPLLISQGSAERSVTVALPSGAVAPAQAALKATFRLDLSHGDVEELFVQHEVALIAVVGLGMAASPGIAGRVFGALGEAGTNVLAIAQGSSEVNISLAVRAEQAHAAIRALCQTFGLSAGREEEP